MKAETNGDGIHVIPIDDLREHEESDDCWCKPQRDIEQAGVVAHSSMDQRELYERGERLMI